MKRIILTLAIFTGLSLSTFAASKQGGCHHGKKIYKSLNLSDEQKAEMKTLEANFEHEKKTIRMTRITVEMQDMKIKELRKTKCKAEYALLTPEQQDKLKSYKHDQSKKRKGKHGQSSRAIWVLAGIELTAEQKEQYKSINEQYKTEREELKAKRKEVDNKQMQAVYDMLTPEQQATFTENKAFNERRSDDVKNHKKLSKEDRLKIKELKTTYKKEVEAINKSRITEEAQKMKIAVLRTKLEKDIQEIASPK